MIALLAAALLAAGPTASSRPAVTGTLQVGQKLTATTGTWASSGTIAYAYQWYRCDANGGHCSSVHGATRSTYTLVEKDVGATIGLTVHASDSSGTADAFAPLAGLVTASAGATAQPPLEGDPIVGQPLHATAAATWKRCNANGRACATIAGATADTYTLVADDAGHTIVAVAGGVWSRSSGLVRTTPGPVVIARPSVAGTLQQGKQLRASAGTWSGSGTVTYAYQWYRCDANGAHCASVHGATRSTYTLAARDAGATIGLTVRAADSTGTTAAYAPLAGLVAAASATLVSTAQPALTGAAPLKIAPGTWSGKPTAFAYAWLRCNANGRICAAIAGATSDTYAPVAGDRGHALVARVTATAGTVTQTVLTAAAYLL